MRALVLAAGLGTRLRPLTEWLPKPLVPVGDRPALAHATSALRAAGATTVAVNAFAMGDALRAFAREEGLLVSSEDVLLGTAGGLARVRATFGKGDWVVWNGDVLLPAFDPGTLSLEKGALATLVVRRRPEGEGNVGIDARGYVTRLRGETTRPGEIAGGEFLGVHLVGGDLDLPAEGCLVGDVYLPALRAGRTLGTLDHAGVFHDVGTIAAYVEANHEWLRRTGASHYQGKGATIAPFVSVRGSVIGAGAEILADCERAIVWPRTRVTTKLVEAIATPFGIV